MFKEAIKKVKHNEHVILIALLVFIGILYVYLATLPKFGDFYDIEFASRSFVLHGLNFFDSLFPKYLPTIGYPPTYYIIQGAWIKIGSLLFHYDLNTWTYNSVPPFYPLWGMATHLACLFAFVALSYFTLKNKWLSLLGFGTFTFISMAVMGQIDIFPVLFVYISMLLMLKASDSSRYLSLIFLSFLSLGISIQFKTYGGILMPLYGIYALSLLKSRNVHDIKAYGILALAIFAFFLALFAPWIPFMQWFAHEMLSGESNWLFNLQIAPLGLPPLHNISIWLVGYAVIIYDSLRNALKPGHDMDKRHFIFYSFAIIAWFFAMVYTHPQWWVLLLPAILLVLDNFRNKLNYLLCTLLMILFLFYPMMWVRAIDEYLVHYVPVIPLYGEYATILVTSIVAILIIWALEIKAELRDPSHDDALIRTRSGLDSIAPLLILAAPFLVIFLIAPPLILSVGASGAKNVAYDTMSDPIYGNITVGQSFTSPRDDMYGIGIRFTYNKSPTKDLIFHLKSNISSPDIATVSINPQKVINTMYTRITFPDIADSKDKRYYFFVESPDSSPGDAVSVLYKNKDIYSGGAAYMKSSPLDVDLSFETIHKSDLSDIMSIYY